MADRPVDQGPMLRVAVWVMVAVSFLFMTVRFYAKYLRHRTLHLDDGVLLLSWLMLVAVAVCTTVEIAYGFGRHAKDIHDSNVDVVSITGLLVITFTICAQVWSKTSWGLTLLRLSQAAGSTARNFTWFAIVSMNVLFAAPGVGYWLQCQPVEKAWHPRLAGTCWRPEVGAILGIIAGIYSGFMDLAFALLPWLLLRHLHTSSAEKLGVTVAMSMGVFAAMTAFIKSATMPVLTSTDFSFAGVMLTFWGAAEPAITIMAASVPMMRVLVQIVYKRRALSDAGASSRQRVVPSEGEAVALQEVRAGGQV